MGTATVGFLLIIAQWESLWWGLRRVAVDREALAHITLQRGKAIALTEHQRAVGLSRTGCPGFFRLSGPERGERGLVELFFPAHVFLGGLRADLV